MKFKPNIYGFIHTAPSELTETQYLDRIQKWQIRPQELDYLVKTSVIRKIHNMIKLDGSLFESLVR